MNTSALQNEDGTFNSTEKCEICYDRIVPQRSGPRSSKRETVPYSRDPVKACENNHYFHRSCLRAWTDNKDDPPCPVCREPVTYDEREDLIGKIQGYTNSSNINEINKIISVVTSTGIMAEEDVFMIIWDQFYYNSKAPNETRQYVDSPKRLFDSDNNYIGVYSGSRYTDLFQQFVIDWFKKKEPCDAINMMYGYKYRLCMNIYGIAMSRTGDYHDVYGPYYPYRHNLNRSILEEETNNDTTNRQSLIYCIIKNVRVIPDDYALVSILLAHISKNASKLAIENAFIEDFGGTSVPFQVLLRLAFASLGAIKGVKQSIDSQTYMQAIYDLYDIFTNGHCIVSGHLATIHDSEVQGIQKGLAQSRKRELFRIINQENIRESIAYATENIADTDIEDLNESQRKELALSKKRQRFAALAITADDCDFTNI